MEGQVTISLKDFDDMRESLKFRSGVYEVLSQHERGYSDSAAFEEIMDIVRAEKLRIIKNSK